MSQRVKEYYNKQSVEEWGRLARDPRAKLEFDTTLKYINKYTKPKSRIADIGAGPGRYSFELAKHGHKVTLVDYSPGLLGHAKKLSKEGSGKVKQNIENIQEASVVNLNIFKDSSFDTVLCLGGVLSHLLVKNDQKRAISELKRIAKKKGTIIISVIGRLALLRQEVQLSLIDEIRSSLYLEIMEMGDYDGSIDFTACHFFLAEEFRSMLEKNGLSVIEMVGLEGLVSNFGEQTEKIIKDKKAWTNILKTHEKYQKHPSVVDTSEHILAVCKIK